MTLDQVIEKEFNPLKDFQDLMRKLAQYRYYKEENKIEDPQIKYSQIEPYERDLYQPGLLFGWIKPVWNRFKFYLGVANLATYQAEVDQSLIGDEAKKVVRHEGIHLTHIKGYNESYTVKETNLQMQREYDK